MLSYELAKELKEAGFPQRNLLNSPFGSALRDEEHVACPTLSELIEACGSQFYELVKVPINNDAREHETWMPHCWCLPKKEVINGNIVVHHNDIEDPLSLLWNAHAWAHKTERFNNQFEITEGCTPEEAVAILYLALHDRRKSSGMEGK